MDDGAKLVFKVSRVRPRFKVITSSIRDDTRIQNVNLADAPAIESFILKEAIKNGLTANLDVSYTCSNTPNPNLFWYGAEI